MLLAIAGFLGTFAAFFIGSAIEGLILAVVVWRNFKNYSQVLALVIVATAINRAIFWTAGQTIGYQIQLVVAQFCVYIAYFSVGYWGARRRLNTSSPG